MPLTTTRRTQVDTYLVGTQVPGMVQYQVRQADRRHRQSSTAGGLGAGAQSHTGSQAPSTIVYLYLILLILTFSPAGVYNVRTLLVYSAKELTQHLPPNSRVTEIGTYPGLGTPGRYMQGHYSYFPCRPSHCLPRPRIHHSVVNSAPTNPRGARRLKIQV